MLFLIDQNARLYAADFMRCLLRLDVPYFSSWCMELLVTQLYDQSRAVAKRSLSVIDEACEDQVYLAPPKFYRSDVSLDHSDLLVCLQSPIVLQANLLSLISIRPSVLHLGDMGSILTTRYLSVMDGFNFLKSSAYMEEELNCWHEVRHYSNLTLSNKPSTMFELLLLAGSQ